MKVSTEDRVYLRQQLGAMCLFVGIMFSGAIYGLWAALLAAAAAIGAFLLYGKATS
jgi:hypothetical protein